MERKKLGPFLSGGVQYGPWTLNATKWPLISGRGWCLNRLNSSAQKTLPDCLGSFLKGREWRESVRERERERERERGQIDGEKAGHGRREG